MAHQLGHRIRGNHRIGVDAHVELFSQIRDGKVKRLRLALIGFAQHRHHAGCDLLGIGFTRHLGGAIRRPVIDHNDA